ncbi:MAG TPA: response regulator [Rhizomicrobium sp.]|jgi:PAS domain S-box-containing protein|nr:response regulator [Rhizomicrobium sp.]
MTAMRIAIGSPDNKKSLQLADHVITVTCIVLLAVVSSAVLAGWVLRAPLLTRVSFAFAPTQFNTALCFLLYGAGLAATGRSNVWIPRLIGAAIYFVGMTTVLQSVLGHSFGIDTFFGYYLRGAASGMPLRMADATAVALTALGAALWLCSLDGKANHFTDGFLATLGSMLFAVAAGAVLGFGANMQSLTGWTGFTQIGVPTVCLCVIAGGHLLWLAWVRFGGQAEWLPIPVFFGLLMVLFTLTQEVRDDQAATFSAHVQATAQQFALRANSRLSDMFDALDRVANRWNVAGGTPETLWESDVRAHLRAYPGLVAVELIDSSGRVRWAVPPLANPALTENRLRSDRLRAGPARAAVQSGMPQLTNVIPLIHGGIGFLYMNPLRRGASYDGLQIAVVRANDFLRGVFEVGFTNSYAITVSDGRTRLYSASKIARSSRPWTGRAQLRVRNAQWTLEIVPGRELVSRYLSPSPYLFFWVGLLIISLTCLSAYLALRRRRIITMLREKEEQLERSEERYEFAVKGSGVGLWDYNPITGQLYWSPRYRDILGIADPAFVPRQNEFELRVHREDKARTFAGITRAIERGIPYDGEARVRRDDGSYAWLRLRGIPIFDSSGKLVRLAGSIDDIGALKLAEEALRASEETFRVTLDSAPIGIVLLAPDGRFLRANRVMAEMFGYSHVELCTIDPRQLFPSAFDEDRAQIRRLLAGEIERYEMEQFYVPRHRKPFWAMVTASVARNPDGSARHIVKQAMDISERKEMDRLKSEFISVVSHELRTPLTAIRGSLGLMATAMSSNLSEKALQLVRIGYRNCERLIVLVNDILDMEKLAANRMVFEPRIGNLIALVRQALESNAPYAQKFDVTFELHEPDEAIDVFLDQNRFGQVLANLLSNAAKFSPPTGCVEVTVRRIADRARIEVRDHGPGIPDEFRSRIFGRFMQADSSVTRAKGGTGLGLHITHEIVERMGGWIGFESVAGQGATFWVEFPLASKASDSAPYPVIAHAPGRPRILVCDDDPQAAEIVRGALEHNGCHVDKAHSLLAARNLLAKHDYAAMTLDLILPDGDGIAFFDELRSNPQTVQLPVIVISIAARERREACNGSAMHVVDWISKPVNDVRLEWALRRAIAMRRTAVPRVLHVEDDADLSCLLATALRGRAELICAGTLREAEEWLEKESFAAVVLDIGMPDGSGLSLVERIARLDPPPPVIVLSAREIATEAARLVAAVLVKSRVAESQIVQTVLDLADSARPEPRRAAS